MYKSNNFQKCKILLTTTKYIQKLHSKNKYAGMNKVE